MRWLVVVGDLFLVGFAAWQLLVAYRVVGKPPGSDPKYDAWHRQWSGTFKLCGWGGALLFGCALIAHLLSLAGALP
jgi:hypothetical protein